MKILQSLTLAACALATMSLARATDLAGKWTAEFETQIGPQKYVYEFTVQGDAITGKATFERSTGNGAAALRDIKLKGDDISFGEPLSVNGDEITISYSGKIAGDEMKLTRHVGDFATEEIVAKRVKAPETKPAVAK